MGSAVQLSGMFRNVSRCTALLASLVTLAACGGSSESTPKAVVIACRAPADSEITLATAAYLKDITPRPMRFLVATAGDSALPGAGRQALQDKGPTFLFPPDPAMREKVRAMLKDKGGWPTLLVLYRGAQRVGRGSAAIRFAGRFVGGKEDGQTAPVRAVWFQCNDGQWSMSRTEEERSS